MVIVEARGLACALEDPMELLPLEEDGNRSREDIGIAQIGQGDQMNCVWKAVGVLRGDGYSDYS